MPIRVTTKEQLSSLSRKETFVPPVLSQKKDLNCQCAQASLKFKPCDINSHRQRREPMTSVEETTELERRLTWTKENWRPFFSEMLLRDPNLHLVTQTVHTNVETSAKTNGTQHLTLKYKSD